MFYYNRTEGVCRLCVERSEEQILPKMKGKSLIIKRVIYFKTGNDLTSMQTIFYTYFLECSKSTEKLIFSTEL